MEKRIMLYDELGVNCIIEDDNITFEFDKNYDFLNDLIKIETIDNLKFVYLGIKKILRIDGENIEKVLPVKEIDIKILKALYDSHDGVNSRTLMEYFNNVKNSISSFAYSNKTITRAFGLIPKIRSEMHVYLTEILDAKELIRFLNEYDVKYPMNEYALLDFSSDKSYRYDEIEYNGWTTNLENALKVNVANDVNVSDVNTVLKNREQLLKLACLSLEDMLADSVEWKNIEIDIKEARDDIIGQIKSIDEIAQTKSRSEKKRLNIEKIKLNDKLNKLSKLRSSQASKILYNELLNISLDKLTNKKCDYSIISFSNESRLDFMSMKHKSDKRFNFLYSIEQNKSVKKFEDYSKNLESLINGGLVIGSDIIGFEEEVNTEELRKKLEWVLPVLHIHPGSFLRISASWFKDSTENIYKVLETIKEVSSRLNESCVDLFGSEWGILPPPMIRIAHGVKLEENNNLLRLINEFNAVIEYNLNSNKMLRKMNDYSKVSLGYYDKNKIKYVFCPDSGGLYFYDTRTSIPTVSVSKKSDLKLPDIKDIALPKIEDDKENNQILENTSNEEEVKEEVREFDIPEEDEELEETSDLEKTLYDIFADIRKDEKVYDSFEEALKAENELFVVDDNQLTESQKVESEISRIKKYVEENSIDIDSEYFDKKIKTVNSYNENSNNSDFAKMYLFLLEREMFPEFSTSFKSIEYLYQNKDKEKNLIEKELNRIFALVIEHYDSDIKENIVS